MGKWITLFFAFPVVFSDIIEAQNKNPVYSKEGLVRPEKRDKDAVIVSDEQTSVEEQRKALLKQMEKNKEQIEATTKQFSRKRYHLKLRKVKKLEKEKTPMPRPQEKPSVQ